MNNSLAHYLIANTLLKDAFDMWTVSLLADKKITLDEAVELFKKRYTPSPEMGSLAPEVDDLWHKISRGLEENLNRIGFWDYATPQQRAPITAFVKRLWNLNTD